MANLKDMEIVLKENQDNKNKNMYVEINNELIEIVWISDIGNKIVLHTKR